MQHTGIMIIPGLGPLLWQVSTKAIHPLNTLLKDNKSWDWTQECKEAFVAAKKTAAPVLVHYDPSLPIPMAGDASAYGIGAVISHILPNGQERSIAYTSCTFSFRPASATTRRLRKKCSQWYLEFRSSIHICMDGGSHW